MGPPAQCSVPLFVCILLLKTDREPEKENFFLWSHLIFFQKKCSLYFLLGI